MTAELVDRIGRLLSSAQPAVTGTKLLLPPDCPRVDVDDFGQITAPLTAARLRELLQLAIPAPYGKGEETLLDPDVRDTWQIPGSLVTVDWDGRLPMVLDEARTALGLPPGCTLRAEYQSLLIYEKGQFFLTHQDSQKSDDMVASLVVMLPSNATGGELVVQDTNSDTSYAPSRAGTSLAVFYADRPHEVRPVTRGHRIVLTYTLSVAGSTVAPASSSPAVDEVTRLLGEYFTRPEDDATPHGRPPTRFAYLLDHEYPTRGLTLDRLKGADAEAAATLIAAAQRLDCETVLAVTDVHETRDEYDPDGEPLDHDVTATHIVREDGPVEETTLDLTGYTAEGLPTRRLRPYADEYEGYMGNYGNTVDRWYRRVAILIWPRRLSFALRCETDPVAAMRGALVGLVDDREQTLADIREALPAWPVDVYRDQTRSDDGTAALLTMTLVVAANVDDADVAAALLRPFAVQQLRAEAVDALVALGDRYGDAWLRGCLRGWASESRERPWYRADDEWITRVPDLVHAAPDGSVPAIELPRLGWARLRQRLDDRARAAVTRVAREHLALLGNPLAAVLSVAPDALRAEILESCCRDDLLDVCIVATDAAHVAGTPAEAGIGELASFAVGRLQAFLDSPQRAEDDWAIRVTASCPCELCARLTSFLADATMRTLEWPLATDGRRHLHAEIDRLDLPVTHTTRRSGRPYTLVLAKTRGLFDREAADRRRARSDLDRLKSRWGSPDARAGVRLNPS